MSFDEAVLWERLNKVGKAPLEPDWLGNVYCPSLSADLRKALAERLGLLGDDGWGILKTLLKQHGKQSELIHAAGLCHQPEARDWLIQQLGDQEELELEVLQAMACWGAIVPTLLIKRIFREPSQAMRMAGLELLNFKAYQLSDDELLNLLDDLLNDIRDPVVLNTIRILQRRDGVDISNRIAEVARKGSEATTRAALLALGCIGTSSSQSNLFKLSQSLPTDLHRDLAKKQLAQQYRSWQ